MAASHLPPPPPPLLQPNSPTKTQKLQSSSLLFAIFLIIFLLYIPKASSRIVVRTPVYAEYAKHCNEVVPEAPPSTATAQWFSLPLSFHIGYFIGGDSFFNQSDHAELPKSASLVTHLATKAIKNDTTNVYKIRATLGLKIPRSFSTASSNGYVINRLESRQLRIRAPRIPMYEKGIWHFTLNGYWSESTGRLCMVGSMTSNNLIGKLPSLNVVLKLNYSEKPSVFGSLVSGILECVNDKHSSNYFEPVSILAVKQNNEKYDFMLAESRNGHSCFSEDGDVGESLSLSQINGGLCSLIKERTIRSKLEYGIDCDNASCSPLGLVGYVPSFMFFRQIRCLDEGKMQVLLGFRNSNTIGRTIFPFDPSTTLIAEGAWDEKKNKLCGVACRILNFTESLTDAFVGDCSTRFSLRIPKYLSLKKWGSLVGHIWNNRTENDPSNFGRIGFSSIWQVGLGFPDIKYEYTEIDNARKSCANKGSAKRKGKTYPNGDSPDLAFNMAVKSSKGKTSWGYATPLFVGDKVYKDQKYVPLPTNANFAAQPSKNDNSPLNITYKMTLKADFNFGGETLASNEVEISAEGIYDRDVGILCMIGCRQIGSYGQKFAKNYSLDCDIMVSIQFSPLNDASSEPVKGTIESTRTKSDPLYFERIDVSSRSMYTKQAKDSVSRMDLEITMVLITNTLKCVFLGLQLFHGKKHPDVLPFISVVMLIVLTLGHMIPLLLNFEALFVKNHNQQNAFLESGGWLEVNEIIVRMVTMIAFLLQSRLLQLTWSARQVDESQKHLWYPEKKVLYVSLPIYIGGGFIAWCVHLWKNSHQSPLLRLRKFQPYSVSQQPSLWTALKSYGGLVLDGFLLPQIAFNIFSDSSKKALAASFYIGTTLVRLLPHAYDLYRAHSSSGYFDWSYIYANHKMDFYSTAWDIIIAFGGLVFAVVIFVQQQFGGRSLLPRRYRESSVYEKVPVVSSEELQGDAVQKNFYSL